MIGELISFSEASKFVPGACKPKTVRNWAMHGVAGVMLETKRIGGKVLTTRDAVERFLARVQEAGEARRAK